MDAASRCVVLVPVGGAIDPGCEDGLRELERRGHPVRRVRGYSQIDAARGQMATEALSDGFDELMWIDSDVAFDPDDVEKLRGHGLPFTCGLYPKKGAREFAAAFLPGTSLVRFGRSGGLVDVLYCGFGFTHTRRAVYDAIRARLALEECNLGFHRPLVPYFAPLVAPDGRGDPWYLGEDYAFCERARRCGYAVRADTTIRLWHIGSYRYGWEDAGRDVERFADYAFQLPAGVGGSVVPRPPVPRPGFARDWHAADAAVWAELLAPLAGTECHALAVGGSGGAALAWLRERVLTHSSATLTCLDDIGGGSPELPRGRYDFLYVEKSSEAADVLAAAVRAWPLVRPGGLVCFDGYRWWVDPAPERSPKLAVDAFLAVMRGRCELVHKGDQVWVRKPSA